MVRGVELHERVRVWVSFWTVCEHHCRRQDNFWLEGSYKGVANYLDFGRNSSYYVRSDVSLFKNDDSSMTTIVTLSNVFINSLALASQWLTGQLQATHRSPYIQSESHVN